MTTIRLVVLILGLAGLIYVSRKSLRQPSSHGFYRFWAWAAILMLFVLVMPVWFRDPFSWYQLISWLLLIASLVPLVLGLRLLGKVGRIEAARNDPALMGFEKTSKLVAFGIFRYIRHPMYSSLLLLAWGIFFKAPSWLAAALAVLATGFLIATARVEERENISFFGAVYSDYMKRTRMFIPFLF